MRLTVKFYNKKTLIVLNDEEKNQKIFSLCLEALKRFVLSFTSIRGPTFLNNQTLCFVSFNSMNEEIVLTNNKNNVMIYKKPEILLYPRDKVSEVLDNNDEISIILNENVKFHAKSYSLHFNNCSEDETNDDLDDRAVKILKTYFIFFYHSIETILTVISKDVFFERQRFYNCRPG